MTEDIMKLSDIQPLEHCPKCGASTDHIERRSVFDRNVALWDLAERCSVCKYSRTFVNVGAG